MEKTILEPAVNSVDGNVATEIEDELMLICSNLQELKQRLDQLIEAAIYPAASRG